MTNLDAWKLDSGFETEFTLTIDSAYFAPDANFNGNTVLHMIGHKPNGDSRTQIYGIGSDWESNDGGNTVTHPTKTRFNMSSNYGHFMKAALELPGFEEYAAKTGDPTDARIWVDLTFDLVETEIARSGTSRLTGEPIRPSRVMLPVAVRYPDQLPLTDSMPVNQPTAASPAA